jgi:hypothetical protein
MPAHRFDPADRTIESALGISNRAVDLETHLPVEKQTGFQLSYRVDAVSAFGESASNPEFQLPFV